MEEFESPRRRLKQGIQKTHQFLLAKKSYFNSDYHSEVVEFIEEYKCNLHKLKIHTFPPDEITDLVYEAIEAFRSTLDQTAYACAVLSGNTGKTLTKVYFPISNDPDQFENRVTQACSSLHPEIQDLFSSFKAYPGGNDALNELNLIRRQGYHRVIVPVGTLGTVKPGLGSMSATRPEYIPAPVWDKENHELVYKAECPSGTFGYNAEVKFDIAFGEVDGVSGKPVWNFLLSVAEAVDEVVNLTQEKAKIIWG